MQHSLLTARRHRSYRDLVLSIVPGGPVAYWPLTEASGATVQDASGHGYTGTYTGVDYGQAGLRPGETSPGFGAGGDRANVFSAGLASAFNGATGTLLCWVKLGLSAWTDATFRSIVDIEVNSSNRLLISKSGTNNVILIDYVAGGTLTETLMYAEQSTDWLMLGMTWDKPNNRVWIYLNGTPFFTSPSIGTWSGTIATAVIGAMTAAGGNGLVGNVAHVALWNTPLTGPQVAALAVAGLGSERELRIAAQTPSGSNPYTVGVVSLTFDDDWDSQYTLGLPKMQALGLVGTLYSIRERITTTAGLYMSLVHLQAMVDAGFEVAPHAATINNHNRTGQFTTLTNAELRCELNTVKRWIVEHGWGTAADYALPFGNYTDSVLATVGSFMATHRGFDTGTTAETLPPANQLLMRQIAADSSHSLATLQAAVATAKANNTWLILTFHKIVASAPGTIEISQSDFNALMDTIAASGMPVQTVSQVWTALL